MEEWESETLGIVGLAPFPWASDSALFASNFSFRIQILIKNFPKYSLNRAVSSVTKIHDYHLSCFVFVTCDSTLLTGFDLLFFSFNFRCFSIICVFIAVLRIETMMWAWKEIRTRAVQNQNEHPVNHRESMDRRCHQRRSDVHRDRDDSDSEQEEPMSSCLVHAPCLLFSNIIKFQTSLCAKCLQSAPWRCPCSARIWFVAQSGDLS